MARSLFDPSEFGPRRAWARPRNDFDDDAGALVTVSVERRKFKWPWIYRFIGYHLMAALGIVVAFVAWLLMMAARS